ncbi:MAG: argininosuccinate synthase [Cyclobacteriaceae bacterium]|nr:argininosuccinate synthase [Cyclobacteriaceae bacterium]
MKKVVLAYSGGLDTSYCAIYLSKEKQLEVHSVIVNTGGFSESELKGIAENALKMGVSSHESIDVTTRFYEDCVKYLVYGNVLRNNTYPLSVSAERVFQALAIVEYAKKVGADYVAHGSTGAGNDQVRFDLIFQILAPEIEILTPIRDLQLSRQEEMDFLRENGVDISWEKAQYSINKGLWGTSVGGVETLTSHKSLPEHAYPSQRSEENPVKVTLKFNKGQICGLDDFEGSPLEIIQKLEKKASRYAIGRDTHVGDTIIGIKGRVGFEAAAPLIIIKAHHLLEKHVLTKWQQYWKDQLGVWYGMQIHEGQYLEPALRNIEKLLEDSQENVTGEVIIKLEPYRFTLEGIRSDHDLMASDFGSYGEMNKGWSGEDVKSFTTIIANPMKIYYSVNKQKND